MPGPPCSAFLGLLRNLRSRVMSKAETRVIFYKLMFALRKHNLLCAGISTSKGGTADVITLLIMDALDVYMDRVTAFVSV